MRTKLHRAASIAVVSVSLLLPAARAHAQEQACQPVVLGWGALVMGPIRVGHRVVIGHGAIVTNDVPDDAVVPDREHVLLRSGAVA